MKKYRKKPLIIEAIQYDGTTKSARSICDWINNSGECAKMDSMGCIDIYTPGGIMKADEKDWILKGIKGEFYVCKPDIFAQTHEEGE